MGHVVLKMQGKGEVTVALHDNEDVLARVAFGTDKPSGRTSEFYP